MGFYFLVVYLANAKGDLARGEENLICYVTILTIGRGRKRSCTGCVVSCYAREDVFPLIRLCRGRRDFFRRVRGAIPTMILLTLPKISKLGTTRRLHSLCPKYNIV